MPFQGNPRAGAPDPAFLQFLFNRQDARAKAERQSGLDQAKAAAEAEKAGREKQLFDIELATKRIDALDKLNDRREGVAAGQRALEGKLQPEDIAQPQGEGLLTDDSFASIVGGLDPQGVAAVPENAFRRDALASEVDQLAQLRGVVTGQGFDQSRDVISGQGSLATAALRQDEQRGLSSEIAKEVRASDTRLSEDAEKRKRDSEAKVVDRAAVAQEKAVERGEWKGTEIDSWRKGRETQLKFVDTLDRDRRNLANLKEGVALDAFQLLQMWQRRVDEGATVRAEDITIIRIVGASGKENLEAKALAFFDANDAFPPEFLKRLKESFGDMLEADGDRAVEMSDGFEEFADDQDWSEKQKNRALPYRRSIRKERNRISERDAENIKREEAIERPIAREEFNITANAMATSQGIPVSELPRGSVNAEVKRIRRQGAP